MRQDHGQQGGYIAFARGGDTLCIEFGKSQTAGVLDGGEQVETTQSETRKAIGINYFAQALVYAECACLAVFDLAERCYFADVYFH